MKSERKPQLVVHVAYVIKVLHLAALVLQQGKVG